MQKPLTMQGKVWLYPGENAQWHFFTIPKKETTMLNKTYDGMKRGWGSLPVEVTVGETTWRTSVFPDRKSGTYLLPLKAQVRKSEDIEYGDKITVTLLVCP